MKPIHNQLLNGSRAIFTAALMTLFTCTAVCAQAASAPTTLSLREAIDIALKQNKSLALARLAIEESRRKKEIAFSHYLPEIKNESALLHLTELAGVTIPAGAFGVPSTGPIPSRTITIDQGALTTYTSGTGLAQPVTQMFKIHEANSAATSDIRTAEIKSNDAVNELSLAVRQVYYGILIAQEKRSAAQAAVDAATLKLHESTQAVAEGRALEVAALEATASELSAHQELLTIDLDISDLYAALDSILGLPLDARPLLLQDSQETTLSVPSREEAIQAAREQSADVRTAQQAVFKAQAGLRAAKDAYIPDITGLARYSYQSGVPFLAHNFGTFGFSFTYSLFDGGRRESEVQQARIVLKEAELNLSRVQDQVDLSVRAASDKVERMEELVNVAKQVLITREEAERIADRMLEQDASLASTQSDAHAKSSSAKASYLEAQLGLDLSRAELLRAIGRLAP